jgi:hypothetical protein
METVKSVTPLEDYKVSVVFSDGVRAKIDIQPFIKSNGISKQLNDETFFKSVKVDETGGITWSNGFDFCPVFLREIAQTKPYSFEVEPSIAAELETEYKYKKK